MKRTLLKHHRLQVCALLLAGDCLVFSLINPFRAPALWLITGYVLLGLTLFAFSSLLAVSLKAYGTRVHATGRRLLRYGAATSIILLGLQSIGQLTIKDVATFLPFIALAYLYFGYGKRLATEST